MLIIDKNKDYYDYLSRLYGVDKKVTFDRRGSTILTQEALRDIVVKEPRWNESTQYFVLEVGNIQFLFQIANIEQIQKGDWRRGHNDIWDGEWSLFHIFKEDYHFGKKEMTIAPCNIEKVYNIKKRKLEEVITSFRDTCKFSKYAPVIDLPILNDTFIPSVIEQFVIWNELSNYISAKNNDKNIEIEMTDVERAVNHGFDKKSSFRNPIKL